MDYLKPVDFKQLKAFFKALQECRFNLKQIPSFVIMDGERTPIDKSHCLELLRSFPDLQGEGFKDDNFLLKYLSEPGNMKRILGRLTSAQQIELTKALEEKSPAAEQIGGQPSGQEVSAEQAVPVSTTTGTSAGGMFPGMPSAPSISSMPRRIYRVPPAPEQPKPEIAIANKSGVVTEAGDSSKLVRATSTGKIVEKPPSKIFIANSSGAVVREHPITPSSASRRFNFRPSAAFTNRLGNFGSRIGVFFQRNVGKFLTVGRIATGVSAGIGAITGGALTNGSAIGILGGGGIGALAPPWIRSGGGARFLGRVGGGAINAGAAISNQASRLSIASPGKKVFITAILGFFLLAFGVGFISSPSSQPGSSPPPQAVYPPYQPGAGSGVITCPLNSGRITTGSKDTGGHCSPGYQTDYPCADPDTTGRATAVDIKSPDKTVYLPKLNNSDVTWTIVKIDTDTDYIVNGQTVNGGYSIRASAESGGKNYLIRFVHIESTNLIQGQTAPSETPAGTYRTQENHVHITIEEDTIFKPGDTYFNLCQ